MALWTLLALAAAGLVVIALVVRSAVRRAAGQLDAAEAGSPPEAREPD
jgi:hypothetical protein